MCLSTPGTREELDFDFKLLLEVLLVSLRLSVESPKASLRARVRSEVILSDRWLCTRFAYLVRAELCIVAGRQ